MALSQGKTVTYFFPVVDKTNPFNRLTGLASADFTVKMATDTGTFQTLSVTVSEVLDGTSGTGIYQFSLDGTLTAGKSGAAILITHTNTNAWIAPLSIGFEYGSSGYQQTVADQMSSTAAGTVWAYTTRTLTAPTQIDMSQALPTTPTAGTTGEALKFADTRLDAAVSTRSSHTPADVWNYTTRTLTSFGTLVADIWAYVIEGTYTALQWMRLMGSILFGNMTNTSGTQTFKDTSGTVDRVVGTVDTNGNRNITTRNGG